MTDDEALTVSRIVRDEADSVLRYDEDLCPEDAAERIASAVLRILRSRLQFSDTL